MLDRTLLHRENRPAKSIAPAHRSGLPKLVNLAPLPDADLAPSALPRASAPRIMIPADVPLTEPATFARYRI